MSSCAEDDDFEEQDAHFSPPPKQQRSSEGRKGCAAEALSRSEIDAKMKELVIDLMEVTADLTSDEALIVLNEFGWNSKLIQEHWFGFEENGSLQVRRKCGIINVDFSESHSSNGQCPICLSTDSSTYTSSLRLTLSGCLHSFCSECLAEYLSCKIREGQESVIMKCPSFRCPQAISFSLCKHLLGEDLLSKLNEWNRNFFVSKSDWLKWCPNPVGCLFAVSLSVPGTVTECKCGFAFCWHCEKESHVPVSCELADKWNLKNSSESENISWIIANTKPCPKCRKPIEKNQGCNHMTCSTKSGGCGAEFCWMCLQAWASHGSSTGGFYSCNLYSKSEEAEKIITTTKNGLERYMFYFSRYMNHQKSATLAKKAIDEEDANEEIVKSLNSKFGLSVTDLQFVSIALRQIVDCRRVLKWTYVYGFYLTEIDNQHIKSKELFEYLQRNLEELTDTLHEYMEKDLGRLIREDSTTRAELDRLRFIVTNQCAITRDFFRRIINDLN